MDAGWGVDGGELVEKGALPELKAQEVPESIGVIDFSGGVFVHQCSDGGGIEQSAAESAFGQQDIAQQGLQFTSKPVINRDSKTPFTPVLNGWWTQVVKRVHEHRFGA